MNRGGDMEILIDGLTFPEGPQWRDGKLWFSDFHTHRVLAVDLEGRTETIAEIPQHPSGLAAAGSAIWYARRWLLRTRRG